MMAVLAIDDDLPSRRAAYAAAAWLPAECHVVALHVGPTAPSAVMVPPPGMGVVGPGYAAHLATALPTDEELEATARSVASIALERHPGEVRVERGEPASMIRQVADEIEADLIVIGTGDRGWLDRLFKPSVSADVAGGAPCSVLVVRQAGQDGSEASEQEGNGQ